MDEIKFIEIRVRIISSACRARALTFVTTLLLLLFEITDIVATGRSIRSEHRLWHCRFKRF